MSGDQQDHVPEPSIEPDNAVDATISDALRLVLTTDPTVLLEVLATALRLAVETLQRPKEKFHAIVVPDIGVEAVATTVDSLDEFLAVCREAFSQRAAQIFGAHGAIILPSEGGDCIVTPWGVFPLATKASDTKANPKGHLGQAPPIPKPTPKPAEPVDDDDDEEEEMTEQEEDDSADDEVDEEDEE